MTAPPLLAVEDLSVCIDGADGPVQALSHVDLSVERGEVVGLVGESGGGKTMIARAIVGLLPGYARVSGAVRVDGHDVTAMDEAALRHHRGRGAAICLQNPRAALAPVRTVGQQLTDRLRVHRGLDGPAARLEALALFRDVDLPEPESRLRAYPHELSGGMCQRVMIAMALACDPQLLLADEPTTGLDVTLTAGILAQFRRIADEQHRGVLLISHDVASVAAVSDRLVVLYAGTVVEAGPTGPLLDAPAHPYTRALLRSVPDIEGTPVNPTPGLMPVLRTVPDACPFVPRCVHADDRCRAARPVLAPHGDRIAAHGDRTVACVHPLDDPLRTTPGAGSSAPPPPGGAGDPGPGVVEVRDVDVVYRRRFGRGGHQALHGVSLRVAAGETVGVVGESGSGKSTLARVIMGLVPVTAGSVTVGGLGLARPSAADLRRLRSRAQMVFQDPVGALSPRRTVRQAIAEPLEAAGVDPAERTAQIEQVCDRVGLDRSLLGRRPHQLSGGQAQRVGIARALAVDPQVVVFDEPTSALDVTVQAQILDLLAELAADGERAYLFISHDLATVRSTCDRVVVLHRGRVLEEGPTQRVFSAPRHPYTHTLLASAPSLRRRDRLPAASGPGGRA